MADAPDLGSGVTDVWVRVPSRVPELEKYNRRNFVMAIKTVITEKEFRKGEAIFRAAADFEFIPAPEEESSLADAIRTHQAKHAVVGIVPYREELYQALPPGGVIARFGVGYDSIDLAKVRQYHLHCTNTPGTLEASVAELSIGLLIAVMRSISTTAAALKAGVWHNSVGNEISGKRLLIVGCGAIGRKLAQMAKYGFNMTILGCGNAPENPAPELFDEYSMDFAALAPSADVVSLHIPNRPENRNWMDEHRLALLQPGAVLLNTARGVVLDEAALYRALASGALAGAGLDVFCEEPYCPVDPAMDLRTLDNVVMTPHLGGSTGETCRRVARKILENLRFAERGEFHKMNNVE